MNFAPSGKLRVVLDTNVYFSAFMNYKGVPFAIWKKAVDYDYHLLISPAIIREAGKVLRERLNWQEVEIVKHLKFLAKAGEIVVPDFTLKVIVEDEADNRILECAVEGKADLIVSGDHHLYRLKSFRNIGIVRPADFYRILA